MYGINTGLINSNLYSPSSINPSIIFCSLIIFCLLVSSSFINQSFAANVPGPFKGPQDIFYYVTDKLQYKIENPDLDSDSNFGYSVAIDDDLIVVGSPNFDKDFTPDVKQGRIYIFNATTGELIKKIDPPDGMQGEFFGGTIVLSDDIIAVSAVNAKTNENIAAGRVFLFDTSTFNHIGTLNNPNPSISFFGISMAIDGKMLLVGANDEGKTHPYPLGEGVVYLFDVSHSLNPIRVESDPKKDNDFIKNFFAISVGLNDDFIIVNSPIVNITNSNDTFGVIYLYTDSTIPISIENPTFGTTSFGWEIAVDDDLLFAITKFDEKNLYMYELFSNSQAGLKKIRTFPDEEAPRRVSADDGIIIVSTGKYSYPDKDYKVHVFELDNLQNPLVLTNPSNEELNNFGNSIDIDDHIVVIGADSEDIGNKKDTGVVYVYKLATKNLLDVMIVPIDPYVILDPGPYHDQDIKKREFPYEQRSRGVEANEIICKTGLSLIMKPLEDSAVCVSKITSDKLLSLGWRIP